MTVMGPIQVTSTSQQQQQQQDAKSKLGHVLMNEHLVCDPRKKRKKKQESNYSNSNANNNNDETYITLQNLSRIRSNPFTSNVNMTLSSMNELFDEFQLLTPQKSQEGEDGKLVGTILDVTTQCNGRDPISSQKISKQLGLNVIIGTTPQATIGCLDNVKTMEEDISYMEKELMYGLDGYDGENGEGIQDVKQKEGPEGVTTTDNNIILAGFIGEITVQVTVGGGGLSSSSSFDATSSSDATLSSLEEYQIKACCMVSGTTNAPVIIGLSPTKRQVVLCGDDDAMQQAKNEGNNKHVVLQILDIIESCGCQLSNIILSHVDIYHYDLELLKVVLDKGVNICFDSYSITYAIHDVDNNSNNDIDVYPTIHQVVNCIHSVLQHNPQYVNQIVLSCGIRMKLQYTKYGGLGYNVLYEHLLPKLRRRLSSSSSSCSSGGVVDDILETMLIRNPQKLLQWWKEPPPKVKPKVYMNCSICKKPFEPIEGTYYSKYTFVYCSRPCLLQHVQRNFK